MSQDAEVTRKAETVFCQLLSTNMPGYAWIPGGGPDGILTDQQAATLLTPPYAVFAVVAQEEILPGSDAYQAQGRVCFLSDVNFMPPETHSMILAEIKQALDAIARPQVFDANNFGLQGFDIVGPWQKIEDEDGQLRCHAIPLALGISG